MIPNSRSVWPWINLSLEDAAWNQMRPGKRAGTELAPIYNLTHVKTRDGSAGVKCINPIPALRDSVRVNVSPGPLVLFSILSGSFDGAIRSHVPVQVQEVEHHSKETTDNDANHKQSSLALSAGGAIGRQHNEEQSSFRFGETVPLRRGNGSNVLTAFPRRAGFPSRQR
jgi:hypothetical protein